MKASFYLPQVQQQGHRWIVLESALCDEGDEVFLNTWQGIEGGRWVEYEQGSRPYLLKMIELMHNSQEEPLRGIGPTLLTALANGQLDYLLSVSIMKDFAVDRVEIRQFEI